MVAEDNKVWDPLRKKMVPLTPEERVRQWFIELLETQMKVPRQKMMSEVFFEYGEGPVKKEFRADILVFDRGLRPLLAVECKRPEVKLTREVMEQVLRYDMALDLKYVAITNGNSSYICRIGDEGVEFLDEAPDYDAMNEDIEAV